VWRRAAWAALIGLVTVVAEEHNVRYVRWISAGISESKICESLLFEGVDIFDPAIHVDRSTTCLNIRDFIRRKDATELQKFGHLSVGGQTRGRDGQKGQHFQGALIDWFDNGDFSPSKNSVSWRLAGISNKRDATGNVGESRFWWSDCCAIGDSSALQKQIGSELPATIADHYAYRDKESNNLKSGGGAGNSSYFVTQVPAREPSIAPLIWSIVSVCLGFCLSLFGLLNFDNERRLLGAALLGSGLLLGGWGFLMWAM
jgi:hypothetical protein